MFPSSSSVKCITDNGFCKRVIKHMSGVNYRFVLNFLCLEKNILNICDNLTFISQQNSFKCRL